MPDPHRYKFVSADNHLDTTWLPKDLWRNRVAHRFKERAPNIVETPRGSVWAWEGKARDAVGGPSGGGPAADGSSNAGLLAKTFGAKGVAVPTGSLPPSDPKLLLEHLDRCAIYAAVFFGDTRKWDVDDPELRKEIYRAYNDFALELSDHAPDRLVVLPILPTMHPEFCLSEIRRVFDLGARAVEFSIFDADPPLWHEVWEPVWAAAEDFCLPICLHIGLKSGTPYLPYSRGQAHAHFSITPMTPALGIAQLIFSGVLERHAKLNFVVAECRLGWIPFLVDWMDRQVRTRDPDPTVKLTMLPSQYFRRQMLVTFEEDDIGVRSIPAEWSHLKETAIFGADYPHTQGIWPDTEQALERMLAGLDPLLVRQVVYDRAARVFRIRGTGRHH